MKIRPVEAEVFRADRWTDISKLVATFPNFANAPNNDWAGEPIKANV
jgi:hypothetical protein